MQTMQPDPCQVRSRIEVELKAGVEIRWACQPIPEQYSLQAHGLFLFGVFWTACCLFVCAVCWFAVPISTNRDELIVQFGVPTLFLLAGIATLLGPWRLRKKDRRMVYVITSHRAMILEVGSRVQMRSFAPYRLQNLELRLREDGSGDIVFEKRRWYAPFEITKLWKLYVPRGVHEPGWMPEFRGLWVPGYFGVPKAKEAAALLTQLAATHA